ncbi:hypothetical protein [Streptomyces sp. NPDC046805]|uniref:hypothetical protein n=1 Tax=Streptomyces sp. NPDC046805 TaxID=3155134 RepID=UPI0033FB11F3
MNERKPIRSQGAVRTPDAWDREEDGARPLVQKLLITVVTGGAAYVLTNVLSPRQDDEWRVVTAVLFGGAILIVQFMITFAHQLGELRAVVEQRFVDIGQATKLFNRVEELRGDGVPRLAENATKVLSVGPEILHDFARREIDRLATHMDHLTTLSAESPGENDDWILALAHSAKTSIDAISTSSVDRAFWSSEPAARYLDAQREAIQERGVRVRRLFIVRNPDEIGILDQLCDEQQSLGIEVRVVALPHLPQQFTRRGNMLDFIIFDAAVSYEIGADQVNVNYRTRVDFHPADVQDKMKRFNELWNVSANGYPPAAGLVGNPSDPNGQ